MKSVPLLQTSSKRLLQRSQTRRINPFAVTQASCLSTALLPAASQHGLRANRSPRKLEPVTRRQNLSDNATGERPWKDVTVEPSPDGLLVFLDGKPVRTPQTKVPLPIPFTKPLLATAVALEWDFMTSAQQALQPHHIPATSIAARGYDLVLQDAADASSESSPAPEPTAVPSSRTMREDIIKSLLPYLDTDTVLCWAPPAKNTTEPSLRDKQVALAEPLITYLTSSIWAGANLKPGLSDGSILPSQQSPETRKIVQGWLSGLKAWELVGLERAVLAGKSLVVGARLVCEWGESFADVRKAMGTPRGKRFGIKEAAEACSLEVAWQTKRWGEVEDTHDVEKEDLKRQFGNAILVMQGS
ncbi:MAG: hypothetical protein LQ343_002629 [Gyalolechia ehrenbergii]|nr:MAG: hypothetical protein LQ343_002629 [Gyalolechia ehrenbergii]